MLFPSPSEVSGTLQRSLHMSLHHWKKVSPLNSTLKPCFMKCKLQPALKSVATARILFVIPGHLCATLAAGGSLSRRRSRVSVVFMVAPFGMDSDLASCWSLARRAVAWAIRRVMDAAESIRAVLFMFGGMMGLGQPEDKVFVTLILLMIKLEFHYKYPLLVRLVSLCWVHCQILHSKCYLP